MWDAITNPFLNFNGATHTFLGMKLIIHAEIKVKPH